MNRGLVGTLVGVTIGVGVGLLAGRQFAKPDATPPPQPMPAAAADANPHVPPASDTKWPRISYAQQAEDLLAAHIFQHLGVAHPSYLDIGAYHPFVNNNSYLFYRTGSHGVLVEPNPAFTEMLRAERPGDKVLAIGIGTKDDQAADYYVFQGPGQDNTFSKAQADELIRQHGSGALRGVIEVPLRGINEVLDEEFPGGAPDFFSIDIEGLDLAVLTAMDFTKHRPKVVCVEDNAISVEQDDEQIRKLMVARGYAQKAGNLVNAIYVDAQLPLH